MNDSTVIRRKPNKKVKFGGKVPCDDTACLYHFFSGGAVTGRFRPAAGRLEVNWFRMDNVISRIWDMVCCSQLPAGFPHNQAAGQQDLHGGFRFQL